MDVVTHNGIGICCSFVFLYTAFLQASARRSYLEDTHVDVARAGQAVSDVDAALREIYKEEVAKAERLAQQKAEKEAKATTGDVVHRVVRKTKSRK